MLRPPALYDIRHLLQEQLPYLPGRLQRELQYDDADRFDSWGSGFELEVEGCFAPLFKWVRS